MPEIIKASEQNLNAVFSDAYLLEIPLYQRPYAWTMEQVDELLDDLLSAMDRDAQSPYFLGSIVLIKNEGDSRGLAGKPLAEFRATPSRRIPVLCGMGVVFKPFQQPTFTSIIDIKKTTAWGESGFPSEFLGALLWTGNSV